MSSVESPPNEEGDVINVSKMLAAANLGDGENDNYDFYKKLPEPVKKRVHALKNMHIKYVHLEVQFYKELFNLEHKYEELNRDLLTQRASIVTGEVEPTDAESDWVSDDDGEEFEACSKLADAKGIPEFWIRVIRSISMIDEMIKEHDIPILKHLTDIRSKSHIDENLGFSLEFHFSENEYFSDPILTKRYFFQYDVSPKNPLQYDGPEIKRTEGCTIHWRTGKNVTVKEVKKVQKKKTQKRTVTRTVQEDSFFNFFSPPPDEASDELDDDTALLLESDFKLGQFFKENVVPRAVLYYTGEKMDSDMEDDFDMDDEDDDDDEGDFEPNGKGKPEDCKTQ